jgi:hypothetical protein
VSYSCDCKNCHETRHNIGFVRSREFLNTANHSNWLSKSRTSYVWGSGAQSQTLINLADFLTKHSFHLDSDLGCISVKLVVTWRKKIITNIGQLRKKWFRACWSIWVVIKHAWHTILKGSVNGFDPGQGTYLNKLFIQRGSVGWD